MSGRFLSTYVLHLSCTYVSNLLDCSAPISNPLADAVSATDPTSSTMVSDDLPIVLTEGATTLVITFVDLSNLDMLVPLGIIILMVAIAILRYVLMNH